MIASYGDREYPLTHTFTRPRGFPYWTLGHVTEGHVHIENAGRSLELYAPYIGLVRPDTAYHARFGGDAKRWRESFVIFSPHPGWLRLLAWPQLLPGTMVLDLTGSAYRREIRAALAEVGRITSGAMPQRDEFADNALEKVLLLSNLHNPKSPGGQMDDRIRQAMQHAATHAIERLTVPELAEMVHMSPSHLAHLFRAQVGASPMQFIEGERLRRAQDLLVSTDLRINEIAAKAGFENPYHFSTRFRKRIGKSPRQYRQNPGG